MKELPSDYISQNSYDDAIDRRGFLKCMAWAGTGLKRFGSVTVLNGHIHQVMQKVEGNVTFHTARGTAFPLPTPGSVPKPIPMVVEATQLKKMLGLTSVDYTETNHTLAVVDSTLE
jgi:3',5'-cyclic-AMP phosphodiesterase